MLEHIILELSVLIQLTILTQEIYILINCPFLRQQRYIRVPLQVLLLQTVMDIMKLHFI